MARCNICGGAEFREFRGRPNEVCVGCGSKARHRIAREIYRCFLPEPSGDEKPSRVLHLAPEACLHGYMMSRFGSGYVTADPDPMKYPHAECLSLYFPQDYKMFPDGYFSAVIHNHVLEHIPGTYTDHIPDFIRLLAPGGTMVFSIPGPYVGKKTVEGGEHLGSDQERLKQFLQEDHFKLFGDDLEVYMRNLPGGELCRDEVSDEFRESVSVRPGKAKFFIWKKDL